MTGSRSIVRRAARPSTARRVLLLAFAIVGLSAVNAPIASAHAVLQGSTPAAGETLERAPDALRLTFSEAVDPILSAVTVTDRSGASIVAGTLSAPELRVLEIDLEPIERGIGVVTWRAYSRVDGHVTVGSFAFGVQEDPSAVVIEEPSPPPPTILSIGGRTLFLAGLTVLLGAVALALAGAIGMTPWALGGLAAALVGVAAFGHQQRLDSGASAGVFLSTTIGQAVIWRAAGLAVAAFLVLLARRSRGPLFATLAVAFLTIAIHVSSGHAGAFGPGDVLAQTAHVLAVGIWAGALAPLTVRVRRGAADAVALVARFSRWALPTVAVVLATGVFRSMRELGGIDGLLGSGYGTSVLVKVGIVACILLLAGVNRFRLLPRLAEAGAPLGDPAAGGDATAAPDRAVTRELLGRTLAAETFLVGAVLAATGLLANLAPPVTPAGSVTTAAMTAAGTSFAGDVRAELTVSPGTPGPNEITVTLADPGDGEPIDAAVSLRVRYRGRPGSVAVDVPLEPTETPGRYRAAGTAFALPGPYEVTVLVQRASGSTQVLLAVATVTTQTLAVIGGDPPISSITFADGSSVQGYLDPGTLGANEVHATYFDADGRERSDLSDFAIVVSNEAGVRVLAPKQLTPGHAVATATLEPGRWRVDVSVATDSGEVLSAWFEIEL